MSKQTIRTDFEEDELTLDITLTFAPFPRWQVDECVTNDAGVRYLRLNDLSNAATYKWTAPLEAYDNKNTSLYPEEEPRWIAE